MKDILVLVASKFEDTELISAINVFDRHNITFDLASIENLTTVKGNRFATISTQKINDLNDDQYRALFLPGGPGHQLLLNDNKVIDLVKKYAQDQKLIAAICAAPAVLDKANLLKGQKATAFEKANIPSAIYLNQPVVVNGNIITGQNYLATIDFALAVVKALNKK